jgi:type IV secretory pathway TrbD component
MKEPTETYRWTVTVLLGIAAIVEIFVMNAFNGFGVVLFFILVATCGALAIRYPPYQ